MLSKKIVPKISYTSATVLTSFSVNNAPGIQKLSFWTPYLRLLWGVKASIHSKNLSSLLLWIALSVTVYIFAIGANPVRANSPIERIVAESINLNASVVEMEWRETVQDGQTKRVWVIPEYAIGWHQDSKLPGQGGNIVLSGRNNSFAELFRNIEELEQGDTITLYVAGQPRHYAVVQKMFLKDKGEPPEVRRENARWIGPINEERLTLVSDWPYANSTHKVVVIAWPVNDNSQLPYQPNQNSAQSSPESTTGQKPPDNKPLPVVLRGEEILQSSPPSLADNPLVAEIEAPTDDTAGTENIASGTEERAITRLVVPSIGLNTPVIDVGWQQVDRDGQIKNIWQVADYAAGWHRNSKKPGQGGNIVFSGHHNINGQVFRYLVDLNQGDLITVYQNDKPSYYQVVEKMILKEKGESPEVRRKNAQWIGPADEEQLTLVTCWPYNTNTHRVVVMAKPTDPPAEPLAIDPTSVEPPVSTYALATVPQLNPQNPTASSAMPTGGQGVTRIVASSINLDATVVEEGWKVVERDGKPIKVWEIPENAAGWHSDSKLPGQGGNVVLSGYHNTKGEVFRYIVDLNPGDVITIYTGNNPHQYKVVDKLILKDKGEPPAVRQQNARWIGQINEERLTLVTGWPYSGSTHRVVVIARPIG